MKKIYSPTQHNFDMGKIKVDIFDISEKGGWDISYCNAKQIGNALLITLNFKYAKHLTDAGLTSSMSTGIEMSVDCEETMGLDEMIEDIEAIISISGLPTLSKFNWNALTQQDKYECKILLFDPYTESFDTTDIATELHQMSLTEYLKRDVGDV